MLRKLFALAGTAFLFQGCAFSVQTDPGDIAELKSLVLAQSANAARTPGTATAPTVIVVAPAPTTAHVASLTDTGDPPPPITRRFATDKQPEIREDSKP